MLLCVLTVATFLLPGTCAVIALKLEQFRYLFAYALSLSLFAICLAATGNLELTWRGFATLYLGATSILIVFAAYRLVKTGCPQIFNEHFNRRDLTIVCGILTLHGAYIIMVGPYDEVPADYYRHLERVQLMRADLLQPQSRLTSFHSGLNGRYWYYLYAMNWQISGANLLQSVYFYSWFNAGLLLSALYLFSKAVLRRRFDNAWLLALMTCLFFVLHQGIVSFAFIRYYALSATLICLPVYFLAILVFTHQIETGLPVRQRLTAAFCLSTPLLYHYQEALFILVMIWLLSLYYAASSFGLRCQNSSAIMAIPDEARHYWRQIRNRRQGVLAFILISALLLALHLYTYSTVTRTDVDNSKVIALHHLLPFLRNLYILNPSYQFYETIALWGVVVYIGFFLAWRRFLLNPYVMMGMLSPLFTVFNPVFVDFFLRIRDVHVLYRLAYIIPFPMAASCLLWFLFSNWRRHSLRSRCLAMLALACISIALFTFDTRFLQSEYSRLPTLLPVKEDRSARLWDDLLDFLNGVDEASEIFTDPVTGYLVTAYTHHRSVRYKFTDTFIKPINFDDYADFPLKPYSGGLLVINLRDGGYSETGALSQHWPADVLSVSRYYSPALLDHVRNNPAQFPRLWAANGIEVYRIHP